MRSHRGEAFATHHFVVTAPLDSIVDRPVDPVPKKRMNRKLLSDPIASQLFVERFSVHLKMAAGSLANNEWSGDDLSASALSAFVARRQKPKIIMGTVLVGSKRPWISQTNLDLIQGRRISQSTGNFDEERRSETFCSL